MNHCVPSFDVDEDYSTPSVIRPKKSTLEDDGIMELLWQNGQVQSQKLAKKSGPSDFNGEDELNNYGRREIHHQSQPQQNLFMQEDEMASWLHYPLNDPAFDNDFCSDLLYSPAPCVNATETETAPAATTTTTTASIATPPTASAHRDAQLAEQSKAKMPLRPPIPPSRRADNFGNWTSRSKAKQAESVPSSSNRAANLEFTTADSNETPAVPPQPRVSEPAHLEMAARGTSLAASSSGAGIEAAASEMMLVSSPGTSSASPEPRPPPPEAPREDRKRKGREVDNADCYSEDIELDSPDAKKHARGSTSAKRTRAAEVHNMSERRRRDRINEKMKALQELVPHCNKADKASMLDEAIEYLKSLQMQVQMMSMGCSMVPMMFPGVQQYMPPHPHMAAAMGMTAMGGMGMNRPMMPFPNMMPGGSLTTAGAGPHMGPRFPMPTPFHHMQQQQQFGVAEASRIIPPNNNSANPMMGSSFVMQNPNHPPNFVDPYQQYLSLHHMQFQNQQQQNQAVDHQGSSRGAEHQG